MSSPSPADVTSIPLPPSASPLPPPTAAVAAAVAASVMTPDNHHHQITCSEQLCYVHCNFCDTVLAVSVPCSSLLKTVTVRCGHCTNLLPVNMRALLHHQLPRSANNHHFHLPHNINSFLANPAAFRNHHQNLLLEEIRSSTPNLLEFSQPSILPNLHPMQQQLPLPGVDDHMTPKPSVVSRPPEKRQRVPSAYNRFIKDEIQRIKAVNPDISHREAFSAAAKNWAHFPHIHFGLVSDHEHLQPPLKKPNLGQQEGEDVLMMKDSFIAPTNVGVSPF